MFFDLIHLEVASGPKNARIKVRETDVTKLVTKYQK